MERKDQIEGLAKAWESLGGGRRCERSDGGTRIVNQDKTVSAWFYSTSHRFDDRNDASPCLAILQDALGPTFWVYPVRLEDGSVLWCVGDIQWDVDPIVETKEGQIDAVRLALESKEREK